MTNASAEAWKHALVPGVINGAINGYVSWGTFAPMGTVALSVDSIAAGSGSAIGNAVMIATALGLILSLINFGMARRADSGPGRPGAWRAALAIALRNAIFLFGLFVALGVIWQRAMGTIEVGPGVATLITAAVAFGVSVYLHFSVQADHAAWRRAG